MSSLDSLQPHSARLFLVGARLRTAHQAFGFVAGVISDASATFSTNAIPVIGGDHTLDIEEDMVAEHDEPARVLSHGDVLLHPHLRVSTQLTLAHSQAIA